ncbi:MAG: hypothetical protein HQL68_09830 [Magnetococcales bacterium]|nr:hypothetical protein [Magnetococcales bacterium]
MKKTILAMSVATLLGSATILSPSTGDAWWGNNNNYPYGGGYYPYNGG